MYPEKKKDKFEDARETNRNHEDMHLQYISVNHIL